MHRTNAIGSVTRRGALAGLAAAGAATALPWPARAAPASRLLDPAFRRSGAGGDPDAGPWAAFLDAHRRMGEDGVARVDYAAGRADRGPLRAWLDGYQQVDPFALSPDAQFAFWVNLYNAATIDLMLEAWPVASIRRVKGGLFNTGPWDEKILRVAGRDMSLDDVEHGVLRPVFGDARVHYAVNCASVGCPDLAASPWSSEDLGPRLDAAAAAYVTHPRGARVEGGRLTVSSIYDWFGEDWGGPAGVLDHLRAHARPALRDALAGRSDWDADAYDWAVNAV